VRDFTHLLPVVRGGACKHTPYKTGEAELKAGDHHAAGRGHGGLVQGRRSEGLYGADGGGAAGVCGGAAGAVIGGCAEAHSAIAKEYP